MWVLISNSIKREKENRLGNRWVIGQDRNCTVIKSLIWWILFNIWVSRSHYESEQQMFRKTRDWLHHFTDFTLIEMFCDWTHLFMRLLKLWTQLWRGQTNRKMENIPKINVNWLKLNLQRWNLDLGIYTQIDTNFCILSISASVSTRTNCFVNDIKILFACGEIFFKYLGF